MNSILTFDTYYKSVIWGGTRIAEFKGIPSQGTDIGESWELSPMEGHESVVADGPLKGRSLSELTALYGRDIMGDRLMKRYGGRFPLLIKFIDSNGDLSLQVHPDDALAAERHNSLGKTEMWYCVAPADGAYLYAGFSQALTPEEFSRRVADNTIVDALCRYNTRRGDVFFLPAGRVHAIGRGNFVLEIQEASDITYRIYDYDRRDARGNARELHVEQSLGAIDFDDHACEASLNIKAEAGHDAELARCDYFKTDLINVDGSYSIDLAPRDSFTVLTAVAGRMTVTGADGQTVDLPQGRTVLVPASLPSLTIEGRGEVVSVFVP
ncbi:MAG: class I mannose-6-phosphate isomerase [Muribaculaceae bacterium]|nr:class I mannose-6-phosphate isomerase [Muribaculaceae bacterium]